MFYNSHRGDSLFRQEDGAYLEHIVQRECLNSEESGKISFGTTITIGSVAAAAFLLGSYKDSVAAYFSEHPLKTVAISMLAALVLGKGIMYIRKKAGG